ncbi:MAG: hypothetical protein KIT69_16820 [Propionibacteriaceae bacterium]|nr:hypothetical protein [Propionibacteriaceae bacterium]
MLHAIGMTPEMLRSRVRRGDLRRLRAGVYLDARLWPPDESAQHQVLARAEQVAVPGAVLSHNSAALFWGLPEPARAWTDSPPSLTVPTPTTQRARVSESVRIHVGKLPAHHVTRDPEGWQMTTLARTAVDVVRGLALTESLIVLDAAQRLTVADLVAMPRRADYANRTIAAAAGLPLAEAAGWVREQRSVKAALAAADPRRESPVESLSAAHFMLAGLPLPESQVPVRTPKGTLYPDFFWREHGLIGEVDGAVKYNDPVAHVKEKEREQLLRDLGYRMVRWLGREIRLEPWVVMERVARKLGV